MWGMNFRLWPLLFKLMKHVLIALAAMWCLELQGQDADKLIREVRTKLDQVKDYTATGKLKTDVAFLKIPVSNVQIYYKKPNRFRVKKDGGISLLPKNGVSVNLNSLLMSDDYTAVPAGESVLNGITVKIIKLLPLSDNGDVVLTTMYIDEKKLLIQKAVTTTRDNGTYDMQMSYGRFEKYGLPDKVIFSFNTKDYKLPKGVTFEYDAGETAKTQEEKLKNKKGKVEILYENYLINKGISDDVFK
jgi:outer membrane lipoprotein-sorting protein